MNHPFNLWKYVSMALLLPSDMISVAGNYRSKLNGTIIAFILAAITVASCKKKEVVASFEVDLLKTVEVDHQFSFSNTSENAISYEWDFGDGNTSTETNPKHKYSKKGEYTVQLTALNDKGDFQVSETVIVVGYYAVVTCSIDPTALKLEEIVSTTGASTCFPFSDSELSYAYTAIPNIVLEAPEFNFISTNGSDAYKADNTVLFRCTVYLNDECDFVLSGDHPNYGDYGDNAERKYFEEFWEEGNRGYSADFPIVNMTEGFQYSGSPGVIRLSVEYDIVYLEE